MVFLQLFGGASLERADGAVTGPAAQRHRLALLAVLAASPARAASRDKLMALLWPERDAEHARNLLNQSVYVLRKAIGDGAILSAGEEIRLDTGKLHCDLIAFEDALGVGDLERAVALYTGPFLDGFHLNGGAAFEHWLDEERVRLASACATALERLAEAAGAAGDSRAAVAWWKARSKHDPYDSRIALNLMRALVAAGNPAGALQHAAAHEKVLREEVGIPLPPDVAGLAEELRSPRSGVRPGRRRRARPQKTPLPGASGRLTPGTHGSNPTGAQPGPRRGNSATGGPWRGPLLGSAVVALVAVLMLAVTRLASRSRTVPPTAETADEISEAVIREVERRLGPAAHRPEGVTDSIAAYELYVRGQDPVLLRSTEGARRGLELLQRAVTLDSTFAAAWAGLACLALRVSVEDGPDGSRRELRDLAERAASRAVALDDRLPEAHAAMGLVRMARFDFSTAEVHLRRAIGLDGSIARAHEWLVSVYLWTGRPDAALEQARRAVEANPLSASANAEVARALAASGRCEEALARLNRVRSVEPPLLRARPIAALCYLRSGRWREAVAAARPETAEGSGVYGQALLAHVLARAGDREESRRIQAGLLARRQATGAFPTAIVAAGLGDADRAFADLDRALEDGSLIGTPMHHQMLDIILEPLRDDPRHAALRSRLRLET